jgi:hypothetical protein
VKHLLDIARGLSVASQRASETKGATRGSTQRSSVGYERAGSHLDSRRDATPIPQSPSRLLSNAGSGSWRLDAKNRGVAGPSLHGNSSTVS